MALSESALAKKRAARKAWKLANPEKVAEQKKRWKLKNPEKVKASKHAARSAKRAQQLEKRRIERAVRHAEYVRRSLERSRRWRAEHPEQSKARNRKPAAELTDSYVARVLGLPRAYISVELLALKREQLTIRRMTRHIKAALSAKKD